MKIKTYNTNDPEWIRIFKSMNHKEPHLFIECMDDDANIYDFTYYSGKNDGNYTPCVCIENIDLDTLDSSLAFAEWQGADWGYVEYSKQLAKQLAKLIIEVKEKRYD